MRIMNLQSNFRNTPKIDEKGNTASAVFVVF